MIFNIHIIFLILVFASFSITLLALPNASDTDALLLNCGSSDSDTDAEGRNWVTDAKHLLSPENSTEAAAQVQDPSLPSTIPYMTARVFRAQSTYNFSLSSNRRHWIRLHFYPTSYSNFNTSASYFSVTANEFTLLNNFSASITSQALTQAYIVREFSLIPIQSGSLNLTFSPSLSNEGSLAFINGIELIPMPEIFSAAFMVGFSDQSIETESSVLQTMFRLNVGGQYIPETKDSGLSRVWYDDSPYLFGAAFGITPMAEKNITIQYPSNLSKYIAPPDVYMTARTMGPTAKLNLNYNLTWVFQIDANFTYFLRLHFCEFQVSKINQRVFDILINNQTAQEAADVMAWTDSKQGVPVYKDFAVFMNDKGGDEELWVALKPSVSSKPEFYDAILNGLEVFKINDSEGNLAGPNPTPSQFQQEVSSEEEKGVFTSSHSGRGGKIIIIGAIAGGLGCFAMVAGVLVLLNRKRKQSSGHRNANSTSWLPLYANSRSSRTRSTMSSKSSTSSWASSLGGGLCRHFSLAEIKLATKNFDESEVIGVGGFGKVYKGIIDGGTKVAIKRSNPSSQQGVHEFQTEIELLSKLRHRHLVSLIGACEEGNEMILVYDYMANGTLREHLYQSNNPPISWKQRLEICTGAARGLHYLHTGAKYTIIHRDVKTTNILLDEKWIAKVSDFGLSKTGPILSEQTHVSTVVKGSFGYLDPEYFRRQQLTEKSDVYSFGVVLFEVLCGRPVLNSHLPREQVSLADWAISNYRKGTIGSIVDQNIKEEINSECLNKFLETAVNCLSDHRSERPSMALVLWNLEFALQLQDNPDSPKLVAEQKANDAFAMHVTLLSIDEEAGETEASSNEIFSQIVNPQGR
ncbi:Non-specific serine/threonine protein kinase [Bertholletia excelsa]